MKKDKAVTTDKEISYMNILGGETKFSVPCKCDYCNKCLAHQSGYCMAGLKMKEKL